MICPFMASAREGETCGDCDLSFSPGMRCGLAGHVALPGEPITAGEAEVCDPSTGICESCE
jgi:hypothetical protein